MVEIKINDKLVDLFPDTKVSGNYEPIDFSGNDGFEVPYTDSFTIPMTNRNASILGFDKNKSSFSKKQMIGKVYANGEMMFAGVVEIDTVSYEILREEVSIRIIDFCAYIFNNTKDEKLGSIMDVAPFSNSKFVSINHLEQFQYKKSEPIGVCFINQTGITDRYGTGNLGGVPSYIYKGRDKGNLPIMLRVKDIISAIFHRFNLTVNENRLPKDFSKHDIAVTFPITYYSNAERSDSVTITTRGSKGYGYFEGADEEAITRFSEHEYMGRLIPSQNSITENKSAIFTYRDFKRVQPNGTEYTVKNNVSIVDTSFILAPKSFSITTNGYPMFYFGKGDNSVQEYAEKISCRDFYLFVFQVDAEGNRIGQYKVGEFRVSEDTRTVENITLTEDYLYSEMLKIEAGQKIMLYTAILPKETCYIYRKSSDKSPVAKIDTDGIAVDDSIEKVYDLFTVGMSCGVTAQYNVLYGDEQVEHSTLQKCPSIFTNKQILNGCYYRSDNPDGYKGDALMLMNMKQSLDSTDITIADFLSDFCSRFNCKISSDDKNVFITKIDGVTDDIIDISTRIDSQLTASISDKDSDIRSISVENNGGNLFMDKYYDGRTYGSSRLVILSENKKTDKSIKLKSSIIPNMMCGKRKTGQTPDVTELYKKYQSLTSFGYNDYDDFKISGLGIRYAYVDFNRMVDIQPLYPTFTIDKDVLYFGVGDSEIIYQPSAALIGMTCTNSDFRYSNTSGKNLYDSSGVVRGSITYRIIDGAIAITVKTNTNGNSIFNVGLTSDKVEDFGNGIKVQNNKCVGFRYNGIEISIDEHMTIEYNRTGSDYKFFVKTNGTNPDGACFTMPTTDDYYDVKKQYRPIFFNIGGDAFIGVKDGICANQNQIPAMPSITNSIKNTDGTLDTLSFNKIGIDYQGVSDDKIVTAYDKYFKDYEESVLSEEATTVELSVYLDTEEQKRIMQGCRVRLYGQIYTVASVSDMDFTDSFGSVVKLKISKLR